MSFIPPHPTSSHLIPHVMSHDLRIPSNHAAITLVPWHFEIIEDHTDVLATRSATCTTNVSTPRFRSATPSSSSPTMHRASHAQRSTEATPEARPQREDFRIPSRRSFNLAHRTKSHTHSNADPLSQIPTPSSPKSPSPYPPSSPSQPPSRSPTRTNPSPRPSPPQSSNRPPTSPPPAAPPALPMRSSPPVWLYNSICTSWRPMQGIR